MQPKDYYKILNVSPTAGADEIRKAFRTLALKYHPDRNHGDKYKEALFRDVQEAYQTLADPKTREEYNYKRWYTRSLGKQKVLVVLNFSDKKAAYQLDKSINTLSAKALISNYNVAGGIANNKVNLKPWQAIVYQLNKA